MKVYLFTVFSCFKLFNPKVSNPVPGGHCPAEFSSKTHLNQLIKVLQKQTRNWSNPSLFWNYVLNYIVKSNQHVSSLTCAAVM